MVDRFALLISASFDRIMIPCLLSVFFVGFLADPISRRSLALHDGVIIHSPVTIPEACRLSTFSSQRAQIR